MQKKPAMEYKSNMDLSRLKKDSEIGKELCSIESFYNSLDSDLQAFDDEMGIHCLCTSGTCCEHFVPDLTPLEAEYLAYVILRDGKEDDVIAKLDSYDIDSGVCPLYNKEGIHHCSVYMGRGLICRLFGAACFVDKDGKGIFHSCKWNREEKVLTEKELDGKKLPIMGSYGRALGSLEGNELETELIYLSLPQALSKLKYILSLFDQEGPQSA